MSEASYSYTDKEKMIYKLYDVVKLVVSVDEFRIGTKGVILLTYQTPEIYEIELFDDDGNTLGLLTVDSAQIEPV